MSERHKVARPSGPTLSDRRALFKMGALLGSMAILPAFSFPQSKADSMNIKIDDTRNLDVTHVPAAGKRRGTILFSHGFRSAPKHYQRLFKAWSAAGYEIFAPLHIDSVEYKDYESYPLDRSWVTRVEDVKATAALVKDKSYIAAGHSYGALLALTLCGAAPSAPADSAAGSLRDPRAAAALALSPPGAIPGLIAPEGYGAVSTPIFVQTGDRDSFAAEIPWQTHLAAYEQAHAGDKYALILEGVDHGFGGLIYDPIMFALSDQRRQLDEMSRLSLLFMSAFGGNDAHARSELDGTVGTTALARLERK